MAVTELSTEEKLKTIYSLQLIDSEIDKIKVLKGELPIEVSDLEDELVGLETRIKRHEDNLEEVTKEVSRHYNNIQESEALIEKYTRQLDNVKNNREFDALTKELEMQKLEIQLSQKRIRENEASKATTQEILEASVAKRDARKKDLENKKVELDKIIAKTEKDEIKLKKDSDKIRKQIEPRLLKSYDKIRHNYRNGLAVAVVSRGACGGCFNRIPPQMHIEIRSMKKIIACEYCGRVLVAMENEDE